MEFDVNEIYLDETKDYLINFQKMILNITFDFMSISQENFDDRVNDLLENIGSFFAVDRTYLFTLNHERNTMVYSHEWCNDDVKKLINIDEEIPLALYPWWLKQLKKNDLVHVEDVNSMPVEAVVEQQLLRLQSIQSIISVPISVDGEIEAFIGIDSVNTTDQWTEENITLLRVMADILSKGIAQLNYAKKINFLAYYDPLTELPNRLLLTKRLTNSIQKIKFEDTSIGLIFINLDGFKVINDTLGYDQGNELLKQVSKRLIDVSDQGATVYRTDGDQFILSLKNMASEQILDFVSSKVISAFKRPFILRGGEYTITASIGISQYPADGRDTETLIESAYLAMHKAKDFGKNQYMIYSDELKKEALEMLSLTNDLYQAIARDELELYYQPQVNGMTEEIVGVEALLRWNHSEYGMIPPFKFIPLAEKTRLIIPIGQWVLKTACKQAEVWREKGYKPVNMAVNFSAHQLNHLNIIEQIETVLIETSMPPEYLDIEITESVAIDNKNKVREILKEMKKLGITLSMDDFGKEYSSLNRLKETPMDRIKIDISFVQGIGLSNKDEIIVKALILLAAELGLETIAEGVETEEQKNFLNKYHCDWLQGYYFHKPMPANEMEGLLTRKDKKNV